MFWSEESNREVWQVSEITQKNSVTLHNFCDSELFNDTGTCWDYIWLVTDKLAWSTNGMILVGKPKYSDKNLSQCQFVHHKSHMDFLV
jgi:hypothetical protein